MQKQIALIFAVSVFLFACEKENEETAFSEGLLGSWSNVEYIDSFQVYTSVKILPEDTYGLTFKENGLLIEHKNTGWCGTPPISYGDYEGTWSMEDSLITVQVPFWGGDTKIQWRLMPSYPGQLVLYQEHIEFIEPE